MPDREESQINGVQLIADERRRQVAAEHYRPSDDDSHAAGELSEAALCYIRSSRHPGAYSTQMPPSEWPLRSPFKPSTAIRDLIKAGALVAAEIDRQLRSE